MAVCVEEHGVRREDPLAGPSEAQHVVGASRMKGGGNCLTQIGGAPGLGVAQPEIVECPR